MNDAPRLRLGTLDLGSIAARAMRRVADDERDDAFAAQAAERSGDPRTREPPQTGPETPRGASERGKSLADDGSIVLVGEVAHVVFRSAESGFCVLRLRLEGDDEKGGERGGQETVVGRSAEMRVGDRVRAVGRWKRGKHGLQLAADSILALDAVSAEGLARSLDGLVYGLGPHRARRLVSALGGAEAAARALDEATSGTEEAATTSVDDSSTTFGSLSWMPADVRRDLLLAWRRDRAGREVEARLASLDLPASLRARLVARYGADAARVVLEEPYRMVEEVDGVGFATADDVALKTGVGVDSLQRVDAAVLHVVRDAADDGGHTARDARDVWSGLVKLFSERRPPAPVVSDGPAVVEASVSRLLDRSALARGPGDGSVCVPSLLAAEHTIAEGLHRLLSADRGEVDVGALDPELTDEQRAGVRAVFEQGVLVLTGPPGTGKTRTCREIVTVARRLGMRVSLCAPTARAAKRLSEMVEDVEAVTIHRLLGARGKGQFDRCDGDPIQADLVLADECSMTDSLLMAALVSAVDPHARLVLVGDKDQLPPVGAGAPFRDVIASGVAPVARLTVVHRQAQGSAIVRGAHGVLRGRPPDPSPPGDRSDGCLHIVARSGAAEAARTVLAVVLSLKDEIGVDPWDALVLAPMRKGDCGVTALNTMLQRAMNPESPDKPEVVYGREDDRRVYRLGDKVRQTKNDYERGVVNGDQGRICAIYPESERGRGGAWLSVDFQGVGVVRYDGQQLRDLVLSYCSTIHSCVSPDTIVESNLGLMRIEEIPVERPSRIGTPTGKKAYENFVENEESDVLSIQTKDGYSLDVTPEHGMDVWNPESSRYERKVADEIGEGDWLRMRLGAVVEPKVPARLPDAPETDVRATRFSFPAHLTEEVAEFLGLMVADGTVYKMGFRLLKRHEDVVERFAYLVVTIFGAAPRRVSTASLAHYSSPVFAYEVNSTQIAAWLLSLGGLHPKKKGVPTCVLRSSSAVQAAFLRGLFEDGTVNVKNDQLDHIEFLTSMPEVASLVRTMLLRLGIASSTWTTATRERERDYYHVYIYGIFAKRFAEKIGFISKFKNDRLEYPIGRSGHVIPIGKTELERIALAEGKTPSAHLTSTEQNCLYRGQISRATLDEVLARSKKKTDTWRDLRERADLFHHVRVERVEWRRGRSMCVTVPDGERFLQNGFCGWNSQGGESPAVVLALVDQHYVMLSRTLLYTAITRAKKACLVVGSRRALETAAKNSRDDARRTNLGALLAGRVAEPSGR